MTTRTTASEAYVWPVSNSTACSIIPRTRDIPKATESRSIRATTAAASAISSTFGPPTEPIATPWIGSRRIVPIPASPAAMTHTKVLTRRTGIPRRAARSADSAEARIAIPNLERRKKIVRATATTGTTSITSRCPPLKTTGSQLKVHEIGSGWGISSRSNSCGTNSAPASQSWAMPMVATVSTSRASARSAG